MVLKLQGNQKLRNNVTIKKVDDEIEESPFKNFEMAKKEIEMADNEIDTVEKNMRIKGGLIS